MHPCTQASDHISHLTAIQTPLLSSLGRHSQFSGRLAKLLEAWTQGHAGGEETEEEVISGDLTPI
jgi:hypothetical protein